MIFDRTNLDAQESKKIILEKIQNFLPLSSDEIETLEKGCLTIGTLNRIEDEQKRLNNVLNDMGYWNTNILNKTWSDQDIFDEGEFKRLLQNLDILKNAFFVYQNTPNTPNAPKNYYHFQALNDMEKILFDIGQMTMSVRENYRHCGDTECQKGEEN